MRAMREAKIRIAKEDDVEEIAKLASRIFDGANVNLGAENIFFVAEDKKKLVGFVHLIKKGKKIVLQGIGVEPAFRGSGIGTGLLEAAISYCEKNTEEILLNVKAINPAAKLYLEHGFFAKNSDDILTLSRKKPN